MDDFLTNVRRREFLGRQKLVFFVTSVVTGLARQKYVDLTTQHCQLIVKVTTFCTGNDFQNKL